MNKQIKFTQPGCFSGRNSYTNMHGIEVFNTSDDTRVFVTPITSRGPAVSTFLEFHRKDIPALITLLQEAIGETEPQTPSFTVREMEFGNLLGTIGTVHGETNDELEEAIIRLVEQNIVCDKDSVEIVNEARITDRPFIAKVRWEISGEGYRTDYELVPVRANNRQQTRHKEFEEVNFDYVDDNGVTHVDGYHKNSEEGECLGFIFSKEFYPKDNGIRTNKQVMDAVNEHLAEISKENNQS